MEKREPSFAEQTGSRNTSLSLYMFCGLFGGILLAGITAAPLVSLPASAAEKTREYETHGIRIRNQSATMYADTSYFITFKRGPVGKEGIPEVIKIGDTVKVKDRSLTVRHIFVTEILEDMKWAGKVLARKGDIRCVIVENIDDQPHLDNKANRNRLWINVEDCEPLQVMVDLSTALQLMKPMAWNQLSEGERDIYAASALETWSFVFYGYGGKAAAKHLSDFVACAQKTKLKRFVTPIWMDGEFRRPVAVHVFAIMRVVCADYAGKGDNSGSPLQLISKSEWTSFNSKKKEIYVIAYVEMVHHLDRLQSAGLSSIGEKTGAKYVGLEQCLAKVGIKGVVGQVVEDEKNFEWQYPIPWSVAKSLGKACRSFL